MTAVDSPPRSSNSHIQTASARLARERKPSTTTTIAISVLGTTTLKTAPAQTTQIWLQTFDQGDLPRIYHCSRATSRETTMKKVLQHIQAEPISRAGLGGAGEAGNKKEIYIRGMLFGCVVDQFCCPDRDGGIHSTQSGMEEGVLHAVR